MYKKGLILIVFLFLLSLFTTAQTSSEYHYEKDLFYKIYFEGEPTEYQGQIVDGNYFVLARILKDYFEVELRWVSLLKQLQFELEGRNYRLRHQDPHMQVDNRINIITPPQLIDDSFWLPLEEILAPLGYLFTYNDQNNVLHINRELSIIKSVSFDLSQQTLSIVTDQPFQYNIQQEPNFKLEMKGVEVAADLAVDLHHLRGNWGSDGILNYNISLLDFNQGLLAEQVGDDYFQLEIYFPAILKAIEFSENNREIKIQAQGSLAEYRSFQMQDPLRMLLDLEGVILGKDDFHLPANLTISQFQTDPPSVRLVYYLDEEINYSIHNVDAQNLLISWGEESYIETIQWVANEEKRGLFISSTRPLEYESFVLKNPLRVVFDFSDARLKGGADNITINNGPLKTVRYAQYDENTVRMVLDVDYLPSLNVGLIAEENYLTQISFQQKLLQIVQDHNEETDQVHLDISGFTDYEVSYLPSPHRLIVDLKDTVVNLEELDLSTTANDLISGMRVSQYSLNPDVVRVVFDLNNSPVYQVKTPSSSDRITLEFLRGDLAGKIVVIDPGHGGFDPGAVGVRGTYEKDVVLEIALKVYDLLLQAGARPLLTRDSDTFISLHGRAEYANRVGADVFISIHANDAKIAGIPSGTETYIARQTSSATDLLASFVHRGLITATNLPDRGIKRSNLSVLTPLRMPGVLLEVAFISNPAEEELLNDHAFQKRVAEAIVEGLGNYFSQMSLRER